MALLVGPAPCEPGQRPPRGFCTQISRALGPQSQCFRQLVDQQDELVYVRLETTGNSLDQLRTSPINERLVATVSGLLLQQLPLEPQVAQNASGKQKEQLDLEAQLEQFHAQLAIAGPHCKPALERLLCRLAYPTCHFRRADVTALVRPICRQDCSLARDLHCSQLDWANLTRLLRLSMSWTLRSSVGPLDLVADGEPANSTLHFHWPHEHSLANCETLPTPGANSKHLRPWPTCSDAHLASRALEVDPHGPYQKPLSTESSTVRGSTEARDMLAKSGPVLKTTSS